MKKLVLVIALAAILATGTAFADHPSGFGIGLVGNYGFGGYAGAGGGLSLKIPGIPIYWAVKLAGGSYSGYSSFGLGVTGDSYITDKCIAPQAFLHFFWGLGGFFDFYSFSYKYDYASWGRTDLDFGLRVPIGLSFQPIKLLEFFLDVAPSFGLGMTGGYKYKNKVLGTEISEDPAFGFFWGIPIELGFRIWL